jgi:hypothetical protein
VERGTGWQPMAFERARACGRGEKGGEKEVRVWAPREGWERERKRGPGHGGGWLGRLASAPGRRVRVAELPCDSGGWWGASKVTRAADGWDRATAGPGGERLGVGGRGSVARR